LRILGLEENPSRKRFQVSTVLYVRDDPNSWIDPKAAACPNMGAHTYTKLTSAYHEID
jgi:hypothetical protein